MIRSFKNHIPYIATSVYIDESAIVIGQVEIGKDSSIWPMTVIRGDVNYIKIGMRTNVQDSCVFHVAHAGKYNEQGNPLIIGDNVTVGHQAVLHACVVENNCLIGIGSKVLDGAIIQQHTILAAGSLVPPGKILESGYLWMGSPAKAIRKLTSDEIEFLAYSAQRYVDLKNEYLSAHI